MHLIALKMLMGDRAKYFGILMGVTFASMLITQQTSVFVGIMSRTFSMITDNSLPDIWVMDPKVQFIDDIKPLQDTQLYRVRSIEGVQWAVPYYKGMIKARLSNGNFQTCNLLGIDDSTLIGGPPIMIQGNLADLRRADSVIVDQVGARGKLAKPAATPEQHSIPLQVGDELELNDHRAVVVGICKVSRTFQSQPVIYTTYTRATTFAPRERKLLSFVLAKVKPGQDLKQVCQRIESTTGLKAYSKTEFIILTVRYFIKNTGIPINIGIGMVMSFLIGTAIAGQTFFSFTLDNLRFFGALKAMGASNWTLIRMILLQAFFVGIIGYGVGVGAATLIGYMASNTEMAFRLLWGQLVISGTVVVLICMIAAMLSIRKVIRLEPAVVFRS